jgi:hypothetical protein
MDSQKIYLLAEVTVLPEFLDDVKGALKQALIPTLQEAGCGHWTQQERAQEINQAMLTLSGGCRPAPNLTGQRRANF